MAHWGARTRQIGTFPVNRENISPAQNAGLPEGSGPLGVAPTCIVRLGALNTLRCCVMHVRRARSTFLHKKRVPEISPLPSSPRPHKNAPKAERFLRSARNDRLGHPTGILAIRNSRLTNPLRSCGFEGFNKECQGVVYRH